MPENEYVDEEASPATERFNVATEQTSNIHSQEHAAASIQAVTDAILASMVDPTFFSQEIAVDGVISPPGPFVPPPPTDLLIPSIPQEFKAPHLPRTISMQVEPPTTQTEPTELDVEMRHEVVGSPANSSGLISYPALPVCQTSFPE